MQATTAWMQRAEVLAPTGSSVSLRFLGLLSATAACVALLPALAGAVEVGASPGQSEAGQSTAVVLLPHRAIYNLRLVESDDGAGIGNVRGRMVYDFAGSVCDGYSTSFRFVTEFQDTQGLGQVTDLRSTSYESADGDQLEFISQAYVAQKLMEESKGIAKQEAGKKVVQLSKPTQRTLDLKTSVLFPTQHLVRVIEAARSGDVLVLADVFDGSESGDKVFATTTIIGHSLDTPIPADDASAKGVEAVPQGRHWPVSIAYFDPENAGVGEQLPAYQMSFQLYENGVSRSLKLDYGDFVLQGTLSDFVMHDGPSGCAD
ncbi:cell envelope integrity EipB family protein [Roseibium sp. CAU 1637]|uniref:Cell envelope integrity EipB family protein n=1 Tax=Roseibium limicola TaxID=2816037 RepID=A0A939EMT2_9HYPH|nr:cell envelope integrity EipB family protein [Roseibium limicola]MBO0344747.1 cell envelope integrity EipB family protein [Roseibium limicola]